MKLRILKLHPDAKVPTYGTDGAGCFDLYAATIKGEQQHLGGACITFGSPVVCGTGLAFEVPQGWVLEVHSRSGQGFNHDVRLANCAGQIDSDYRGELMVKLTCDLNDAAEERPPYFVKPGDRIAQARLVESPKVTFEVAEQLSLTERGENGFGSSGQ